MFNSKMVISFDTSAYKFFYTTNARIIYLLFGMVGASERNAWVDIVQFLTTMIV